MVSEKKIVEDERQRVANLKAEKAQRAAEKKAADDKFSQDAENGVRYDVERGQ